MARAIDEQTPTLVCTQRRGHPAAFDRRSCDALETAMTRCLALRATSRAATCVDHFQTVPTVLDHCEHQTEFLWLRSPRRPGSLSETAAADSGTRPPNEVAPSSLLLTNETSQIREVFFLRRTATSDT